MNMQEFSIENRTRCEHPEGFHHPLSSWSLSDWMTATMGELGEAANIVKKLNRVRDGVPGNPLVRECPGCFRRWKHTVDCRTVICSCGLDTSRIPPIPDPGFESELRVELLAEFDDTFIYLDLMAQAAGFSLADAVREKFDETSRKIGYVK